MLSNVTNVRGLGSVKTLVHHQILRTYNKRNVWYSHIGEFLSYDKLVTERAEFRQCEGAKKSCLIFPWMFFCYVLEVPIILLARLFQEKKDRQFFHIRFTV